MDRTRPTNRVGETPGRAVFLALWLLALTSTTLPAQLEPTWPEQRNLILGEDPSPDWPKAQLKEYYLAVREAGRRGERDLLRHALEATLPRHTEHNLLAWITYRAAWDLTLAGDEAERRRLYEISVRATESIEDPERAAEARYFVRLRWIGAVAHRDVDAAVAMAEETIERILEEEVGLGWIPEFEEEVVFRAILARDHERLFLALERAEKYAVDANDRVIAFGIRGKIAQHLGQMEIAGVAFARAEELARQVQGQEQEQAILRALTNHFSYYIATGRYEVLERRALQVLGDDELFERFPELDDLLNLDLALCALEREKRGETANPTSDEYFQKVIDAEVPFTGAADSARLHYALSLAERNEFDQATALLEGIVFPIKGLGLGREGITRALIAERGGSGSPRDALNILDTTWEKLEFALTPPKELLVSRRGFGPLHYDIVRRVNSERIRCSIDLLGEERGARAALEILLELESTGSLQEILRAPRATLESLRSELLPPGGGLAFYFPSSLGTVLILVDEEHVTHHRLAGSDQIEGTRKRLQALHSTLPEDAFRPSETRRSQYDAAAQSLSELLLPPPVAEVVGGWDSLTVIGLDLLRALPLSELRLADGTTLGSRLPIAVLPSASVGLALQRRADLRKSTRRSGLVVHAPTLSESTVNRFPHVTKIPEEKLGWLRRGGAEETDVLLEGPAASFKALRDSLRASDQYLQFLCHGARDDENFGEPVLLLAGSPGVISGTMFEGLEIPPLVLATACSSGLSAFRSGDPGTADLLGGFLIGGADAVILSIGEVSYRASVEASEVIHAAIQRGATPAEALMKWQRQEAAHDPTVRSSFLVVGLGHRALCPPAESSPLRWLFYAVGAVVVGWASLHGARLLRSRSRSPA